MLQFVMKTTIGKMSEGQLLQMPADEVEAECVSMAGVMSKLAIEMVKIEKAAGQLGFEVLKVEIINKGH
jgi:hypothetical protein